MLTDHLTLEDVATLKSFMLWEDGLPRRVRDTLGGFLLVLTPEAGRSLKTLSEAYRAELRAQRGGPSPLAAARQEGTL